ncbi:MAG: phosphate ABC transporter ATP-binding protein [Anaeromicrobium sp.]|jgi:phosphate transport system ATP-binding protein|uniref:phosphate ABC transporter ATP-binding protein n=1 Tax=Anaeromicrobium sp. TaxID=1929132 RepID=UPI0025DF557C|nr:phosphate ABC transporter ATP-binding protein [Anaeromicrobium sp.]MCT4592991.1 phosphate ABC transporter ATP-binding protein [Anaeromicrobium sp.]
MESILETRNLKVSFNEKEVLNDVNLSFEKNKITAIVGPSGCGKSTLLKCLNTLLEEEPSSNIGGEILFKNKNVNNMEREHIREKIGMVFQNPSPFPMSIYKNMDYPLKYYKKNKRDEIIKKKLEEVCLYEEVKDRLKDSALNLSGGQQQRLCIGRALCVEPEVLLLDEPCSSLDIKNSKHIEDLLVNLKEKYTIIIVTHNLFQARKIADNVIFILDGRVIESDKTVNIFNNPKHMETKNYIRHEY